MNTDRTMWGIVALVVLTTITLSSGIWNYRGRAMHLGGLDTEATPPAAPTPDLSKYAIVDYESATEALSADQIEERRIINRRYDVSLPVMPHAPLEGDQLIGYDIEPDLPGIPSDQSQLVVVGTVLTSRARLSNEKKGVYTEYEIKVEKILAKNKIKEIAAGDVITLDRAGGVVRYPNGKTVLYKMAGQGLPEGDGRFVFFLANEDARNPNYKILTAYRLTDGKVAAVDSKNNNLEFNGSTEGAFLSLVSKSRKAGEKPNER